MEEKSLGNSVTNICKHNIYKHNKGSKEGTIYNKSYINIYMYQKVDKALKVD